MSDVLARLQAGLAEHYRIERELGRGGMATVYLAHDLRHDRSVALKVLHAELAQAVGPERFLREIRLSARLQHPHILGVHDSGHTGGQLWFTMPFVVGETLRDRLTREKQLPLKDALHIVREVADALEYAHKHDVVHRDIKPENILLSGSHALVADFGIARALQSGADQRLTETGITVGTPHYMSPEQAVGDRELDARSDIYSLGCVLYEMLAGEPPYTGRNAQAILAKRLSEPVPHVSVVREVPIPVEHAVSRALARAPSDRFASAAEFAEALANTPSSDGARSRRMASVAMVLGVLLLAVLAGYLLLNRPKARGVAPLASAAVLPFVDLSPQKDQEYFSDGLTEELITTLSQVEGLRVAARTSSFQFKGRNADVREVGDKLNVAAVLEGSVRKSGNRLRVSTQLISVKDGYQLWSDSYDRDLADIFAVQEDIARAIVAALRVRLAPRPDSALVGRPTRDLEAYDLYLKGRFAWNQRTGAALTEAVRYFEQAAARDTTFAKAYAGIADSYVLLPAYTGIVPKEAWGKAKSAALKALALDSSLAEAHASLAYGTMQFEWDWVATEASFRRAIQANPNYATGHHWYADFLAGRGRFEESLGEMRRAHELDPLSRIIGVELGWVYYIMKRDKEALAQVRSTLALDRNYAHAYFILGLVQLQAGRYRDAIDALRRAQELGDFYSHVSAALASAYAASGDRTSALKVLQELQRRSEKEYLPPFAFAATYAGLGDTERGIEWLQKSVDQRDFLLPENFFDQLLDPLRSDRRYPEILKRMGLKP